jgi:hypothetical protein
MKSKCSNLEITIISSTLLQTENLQNRLFLALTFASKKNAASEVLVVELNTKSEKGCARPGKEIL